MDLLALILYGVVNLTMVISHLLIGKGRFYQFPFWAGVISLGWFYPQAIGGLRFASEYPQNAYADGMLFATLCSLAIWLGFAFANNRTPAKESWLAMSFDRKRLYYAGIFLCFFGFFFQWKLWSLPEEMLAQSQWSGAAVKYLFLASVFKFGFLSLWLMYLAQPRLLAPKYLILILPCLAFLIEAALLRGRRSEMMNLFSYMLVGLWLVRRISVPRWMVTTMMVAGLIFINAIGTYRAIMKNKDIPIAERLSQAASADYISTSKEAVDESGAEFKNYIYYRKVYAETKIYDYGVMHWNRLVFNYVPAQFVGKAFKESLYLEPTSKSMADECKRIFGHVAKTGSTSTGYKDAFGSFGWFGCLKYALIGWIMGALYRNAMNGRFIGQLMYLYGLTIGMQSITHGTNDILVRIWIYFFMLCFPALLWARFKPAKNEDVFFDAASHSTPGTWND